MNEDLWTEPNEPEQTSAQNGHDNGSDILAADVSAFYRGLRNGKMSRSQAFRLTYHFMDVLLKMGGIV